MPVEAENQHPNHPYRVRGSRPLPITLPDSKVDRSFVEWIRARYTAERTIEELDFNEELLLSDLHKAYSTPDSDDAFNRSRRASYEQTLLLRAIKLGAPRTIEFMAIPEGYQTYLLWLSGKYPRLNWEPVFETFYREPLPPQRTGKPLMGEWNLTEEQELLLTLRIHADLIPATGKPWGGRLLDSYDDDSHERIESLMESLKTTHDFEPVKAIEFNLPQLRERANYYTTNADKLALHSLLFDPAIDPYEDSELTNQPGFTMSDLLAVEAYYEWEIERLTGEPYVVSVDPMTGMKPVKSIAFGASGEMGNLDLEKDTKESTTEKKQEPQKAIVNSGENPDNPIAFEPSGKARTLEPEKDTKESTPEKKQEAPKAIAPKAKPAKTYDWSNPVWTRNQVAEWLGVTPDTVSRWVKQGKLPHIPLPNGGLRFDKAVLEAWREQQQKDGVHSSGEAPQWRDNDLPFAY